jgi:hypothetical protein
MLGEEHGKCHCESLDGLGVAFHCWQYSERTTWLSSTFRCLDSSADSFGEENMSLDPL